MAINTISLSAVPLAAVEQSAPDNLADACRDLEKVFARMMFQSMRRAMVPSSGSGSDAFARNTSHELLDGQWAELSSRGEGLGLWRALYRQLEAGAVKLSGTEDDEMTRETSHRKEADHDPQGSAGAPGGGVGRAAVDAAAAARSGVPELSAAIRGDHPGAHGTDRENT